MGIVELNILFVYCLLSQFLHFMVIFSTDVNLQLRIEYLSRAVICIKSTEMRTLASNEGEFLHELEEKMEVITFFLLFK